MSLGVRSSFNNPRGTVPLMECPIPLGLSTRPVHRETNRDGRGGRRTPVSVRPPGVRRQGGWEAGKKSERAEVPTFRVRRRRRVVETDLQGVRDTRTGV